MPVLYLPHPSLTLRHSFTLTPHVLRSDWWQVQCAFRHGARTPVEDAGARSDGCRWLPEDTDKTSLLAHCGRVRLYAPGSSEGLDPKIVFAEQQSTMWSPTSELPGGGAPGRLTHVGLVQSVALGADLRSRYVKTDASSTSLSSSKLLPNDWSSASRLVTTRSTCVERTVYSAQGVLAGLFPAAAADKTLDAHIEINGAHHDEFMVSRAASGFRWAASGLHGPASGLPTPLCRLAGGKLARARATYGLQAGLAHAWHRLMWRLLFGGEPQRPAARKRLRSLR
jgi:hypothetical protein